MCEAALQLPGPHVSRVPERPEQAHGGDGPGSGVGAMGTGQAPWAVTVTPGHRGHGACQAWKAHQEKKSGQGVLCPGRGAVPASTPDRVAGTGTLWLFITVRSSQPSRPPVSLGPWAPPASRRLPPRKQRQPPALALQAPLGAPVCAGTCGGSAGRRASVGLGRGAQTWSVAPLASAFSLRCC